MTTVKIQLASDLHLESLARRFPGQRLIAPHPDAHLLVLAGDIASGTQAIDLFADWPVPVVYVMGNHEAYGEDIEVLESQLRTSAVGTQVHFLERNRFDFSGVRFLGTSLWTDYALGGPAGHTAEAAMTAAGSFMTDHREIRSNWRPFAPLDALRRHEAARAWLASELGNPFDGPTVVVTHHGVHPSSVHPRYAGDIVNGAFVSDLGPLLDRADLWLHGHVHDSFDYVVGRSRVRVNPRGYARNLNGAVDRASALVFENTAFDPMCLIEVPTPP